MPSPATVLTIDAILKQHYVDKRVAFVGYKGNPFLAMVPKMTDFGGRNLPIPLMHGGNQGASRTFATAQTNKTEGLYEDFLLTRVRDYALTSIELEAILASMGDVNAFLRASTSEIDNTLRTAARNLAVSLYRGTSGSRGQVGSVSTTALTLKVLSDITNFEVGMEVDSDDVDGGGTVDGDAHTVTAIDRLDAVLTSDATWTDSGNFADDDFLFREGDYDLATAGLDSWLPSADPTSTPFFGVDRSTDVTRLGGIRYDGTGESIEEALISAESILAREGGNATHVFMNHDDYRDLKKSLGSRVVYDVVVSTEAPISFKGIVLEGSNAQPVIVMPDRNCPRNIAYMLQMDTWKLYSLGPAPRILEGLGNKFIWDANADSVEIRTGYYANLGCEAPGFNCRIDLPVSS